MEIITVTNVTVTEMTKITPTTMTETDTEIIETTEQNQDPAEIRGENEVTTLQILGAVGSVARAMNHQ